MARNSQYFLFKKKYVKIILGVKIVVMKKEKVVWLKHVKEDFYEVYNDDAFIISELMDYKLVLEYKNLIKTGFPEMALDKVMSTLRKNKVSYQVSDDDSLAFFLEKPIVMTSLLKKIVPLKGYIVPISLNIVAVLNRW